MSKAKFEFEVGSLVRCINVGIRSELTYKKIYEVKRIDERGVQVEGINYWYDPSRFMSVSAGVSELWRSGTERPRDGEHIICLVDTSFAELAQGLYHAVDDKLVTLKNGNQLISWGKVRMWTPYPDHEKTREEILSDFLGGEWVQDEHDPDFFSFDGWKVTLGGTYLQLQIGGSGRGNIGLWINIMGNPDLHFREVVKELTGEVEKLQTSLGEIRV